MIALDFLDINLFIIGRFVQRDNLYPATRVFLEQLADIPAVIPLMTLLGRLRRGFFPTVDRRGGTLLHRFAVVYPVRILNPFGAGDAPANMWFNSYIDDLSRYVARRMTLGDATLGREVDRYGSQAIVTWNIKDFAGRTTVSALTPDQFLAVTR